MVKHYDISLKFKKDWQQKILNWYYLNKRDLPWRKKKNQNFYRIWISEVMLQQTTVKAVIPYYQKFLKKWPSLKSFSSSSLDDILVIWQGLGYYQRARNLFKAKEYLKNKKLNINSKSLKNIPGIGDYISSAISAILKDEPCAVIDSNIKRIITRAFNLDISKKSFHKELIFLAQQLTPNKYNRFYCQSLMDIANEICKSKTPECFVCPIEKLCISKGKNNYNLVKKKKINKIGVIFVVRFKNEFCVEVSKKKILQGLYQFPMSKFVDNLPADDSKKIIDRIIYLWKINNELEEYSKIISTINHDFTHFHLKLNMVEIVLKKRKK